ncbi:PD-(D/E)XK nuclease family protein, partial [bacterium]|nr:PD-(D/E)XK nuclease family protein [bacterium]
MNPQKLSIRDLVASPDLEFHSLANPERSHAAAQAALGRKYKSFKSEVALTVVLELDNSRFEIHGRMDGIRRVKDGYCIYEIKPVPGNPRQWRHHSKLLRARWQLMLYCDLLQTAPSPFRGKLQKAILLLAGDDGKVCEESIDINTAAGALRKRLCAIQKKQEARRSRQCALESIDRFFEADKQSDRPLQVSAESKINSDPLPDRLLLTLPPGAGKTRLALRFALRAARRLRLPVYWITAKAAGRHTVQEEIERLQALGLKLSFCWKTTADRLCSCDSPGEDCPIRIKTQTALFFGELSAGELAEPSACWCPHQIQQYLQTQSHIVIADINYLLNASSLIQYPAVLIIDEVQHFVNRLLDHSRVVIPLRRLKKLMQRLPASRRLKFSELLNPEWLDDELLSSNPSLWNELAVLLRQCAVEDDLSYTIQRLAALLAKDPDNYSLTWYSSGLESGWIGMIAEPESFVCESLRQYPVVAALSGSLPEDPDTLRALLPGFAE